MYLSHYNLAEKPFQISTDPKFLWLGEKHREALAVLKYSIINNQGFVLLTGDVGTGKTTLINALVNNLDKNTIVAVVSDPKLERLEFFNLIASAFKFKKTFKDKLNFTLYFTKFLNAAHKENKQVLLIIDEAQNISLELLEEVRLLSNIEIPERKLLNTFFVGQSEFNNILMRNECRPLRQRITVTYNIDPLTEAETKEYIAHRLRVAGGGNKIFDEKAIRKIYSFSKGYPRLINIICDHALLTGYVKDLATITPKVLKECTKELNLPGEIKSSKPQKLKRTNKERKGFGKRAVFYSCLLFLLIPLVYPPVSTTLKGYLTNVINFYDQLFQQFAGPAHSHNDRKIEVLQPDNPNTDSSSLSEKQHDAGSKMAALDVSKSILPSSENSSENVAGFVEKAIDLKDFKLVIPFGYNSNDVPENAYTELNGAAVAALHNPNVTIVVKGYTDDKGSDSYNRQLSEFRANIVKSYLVGQGVSPKRVKAIGMGEEEPIESNETEEGRRAADPRRPTQTKNYPRFNDRSKMQERATDGKKE
jgi:general secretion pathway protein A